MKLHKRLLEIKNKNSHNQSHKSSWVSRSSYHFKKCNFIILANLALRKKVKWKNVKFKGQIESQGTYKQILSTSSSTIKQLSRRQTEELKEPDNSLAESPDLSEESKKLSEDMHLKEQVNNQ